MNNTRPLVWLVLAVILSPALAHSAATCQPFFDQINATTSTTIVLDYDANHPTTGLTDVTPAPVPTTPLGTAVLKACGAWGSKVSLQAVQATVDSAGDEVANELLRDFPRYSLQDMKSLIVRTWTVNNAFEHVFCGHPKRDSIGGLHFAGRYLDLQAKGDICRMTGNSKEIIFPGWVYTIGIVSSTGVSDPKKGFAPAQTAEDILYEATHDYLANCEDTYANPVSGCLSRYHNGGKFVSRFICVPKKGIVTFYPLANNPNDAKVCK